MLRVERATPLPDTPAAPAAPVPEGAPAGPPLHAAGTFSNSTAGRPGADSAVTVILMDDLNTPFADQAFAHRHLIKFLSTLKPTDRIAL